jgi:multidrug efflux system membrane fusion protein
MKLYFQSLWSNSNYKTSIIIAVICSLWLASGTLNSTPVESQSVDSAAALTLVKARAQEAQVYMPTIPVRARTEANRRISLRAELAGRVIALPVAEGDVVQQGDTVCELAMQDRQLRFVEARSAVEEAQLAYTGALRLKSSGYQSKTAIASAKAKLDSMKANLKQRELDLSYVTIKAPFTGIVERHGVEVGGYMDKGGQCAVLLEMNPLVITGQVSAAEIGKLKSGLSGKVVLADGSQFDAKLRYVAHDSDSITRMFRIEAITDNSTFSLRSGVTANLNVIVGKTMAHQVPAFLLSLDDAGKVGVRVLNSENIVQFFNVELIGDDQGGVWVLGLPDSINLITVGQEYVTHGEKVAVIFEDNHVVAGGATHDEHAPITSTLNEQGAE